MAYITAHALLSGDGEKMKIDHPTNNPRPSFGQTQKTQLDYQPTFHTKRKTVTGIIWRGTRGPSPVRWYHLEGHEGTKSSHTTKTHTQLQGLGEEKGSCPHMSPGTSMADITAHALLSGDGEKMKIGHPTNDTSHHSGKREKTTRLPTLHPHSVAHER